ncbi:MAG: hypothetical protein LBS97_01490 [Treponema sp.]|nr:hypothetical protein [Treponema sp.]
MRVYKRGQTREFFKLCRTLDKLLFSSSYRKHPPERQAARVSRKQRCVVKARIGYERAAHLKFLKEYLPQLAKEEVTEKPELFSGGPVDGAFVENYLSNMTGRHFKFIISPESQQADMKALTKTLVKRMEKLTGYKFSWFAAVHTDTGHTHAHLLLNGKDKNGREVRFDKGFIRETMRAMTSDICTALIGERTPEEIKQALLQSYQKQRYGEYDELLHKRERPLDRPDGNFESEIRTYNDGLLKRLNFLCCLGLAEKNRNDDAGYRLEKGWRDALKAAERYNLYLKARKELVLTQRTELSLYTGGMGPVSGTVTKIYKMNDEDAWSHAAVIENKGQGKSWFVPLYYEPKDSLCGRSVTMEVKANQKGRLTPQFTMTDSWEGKRQ